MFLRPEPPKIEVRSLKPRVRVKAVREAAPNSQKRVVVIGDVHAQRGMEVEHMRWAGRYIAQHRHEIDYVVQIGDLGDWRSCCRHELNDTTKGRYKPTFREDLQAVQEALDALHGEIPAGEMPSAHLTLGNHEEWVSGFENQNPELEGDLWSRVLDMIHERGWKTYGYGEFCFLEGVGFTHVPKNLMDRPYGGKFPENQIANDAVFSIVYGHTHRRSEVTRYKIGPNQKVTILNVGSFMPYGYTPPHAKGSTTGLTYGLYDLRIGGGQILSSNFVNILDLERDYS